MGGFVEFAALKKRLAIQDAIPLLGLNMRQEKEGFRGPCPSCGTRNDRAIIITPSKGAFYCHAAGKGGDVIALWSHIREIGVKDAALEIQDAIGTVQEPSTSHRTSTVRKDRATVPQNQKPGKPAAFDPEAFTEKLSYSDELAGIVSADDAQAFRVGVYKGHIYVPAIYPSGSIAGWWKLVDGELVPPVRWLPDKIVKLYPKKTA